MVPSHSMHASVHHISLLKDIQIFDDQPEIVDCREKAVIRLTPAKRSRRDGSLVRL